MRFHKFQESLLEVGDGIAADALNSAQKFYVGDVKSFDGIEFPTTLPRLPYETCAFELTFNPRDRKKEQHAFVLGQSAHDATMLLIWLFEESNGKFFKEIGCVRHPLVGGEFEIGYNKSTNSNEGDIVLLLRCVATYVALFLSVINCSNVAKCEVLPPQKLNKSREAKGKIPIFSYWVLELKAHGKSNNLGGTHEPPRIHLCRGHIKRRKTGNFWWQPHVRGDRKRGMVVKDYKWGGDATANSNLA